MFKNYINTSPFLHETPGAPAGAPPAAAPPAAAPPAAAPPAAAPPAAAPPAAAPPAGSDYVPPWGTDVNKTWMVGDKPWYDVVLPDGPTKDLYRDKKYANPVVSADAYYSSNRMVNGNAVEVPGADATQAQLDAFYTKLGRPDAAEKYELKFGDGVAADPTMSKFGKDMAFKLGLSPKQAQTMADSWQAFVVEANGQTVAQNAKDNAAEGDAVKARWGEKYAPNLAAGQRVVNALFDLSKAEDKAAFGKIEGAIGASAMLELFARIGAKSGEGSLVGGGATPAGGDVSTMTPQQAQAEIAKLSMDTNFQAQYQDRNNVGHKAAVDKMAALYARQTSK